MSKIWTWIKVNLASVLGIAQAVVKALKEVVTAIVNLLSIFLPTISAQKVVVWIRNALNIVDEWIEKIKVVLIPIIQ